MRQVTKLEVLYARQKVGRTPTKKRTRIYLSIV